MKSLFPAGYDASNNNASTSDTCSGDGLETGSTAISRDGDCCLENLPFFGCYLALHEIDMNPLRVIMAETVGTFILMFSVCGIIASTRLSGGQVGLMEYAATAGLSVVVVIFAVGPISGAHVNPAVTVAFAIFGSFPWPRVPFYILAQTVGSVLATWAGRSIYGVPAELMATQPLRGCASAFWVELVATFVVVFSAVSLIYESESVGRLSGIVLGAVIGLGVLVTGPVSGGSMNPARSLGPAILSWDFKDIWIYIIAPVSGAVSGALLYRLLRLKPTHRNTNVTASSPDSALLTHSLGFNPT